MVFMCVICMVKEPPLVPLSYDHRQLLEVIVSPVINTSDLKGYEWLYCVDCKMLMQSVHNFQQSARKGVKAFKYMLSKLNKQTVTQNVGFEPISEAKQDPIAIKTEPETDLPSVDQKPMVPEEDKTLHEEVDIKMEIDMEPEVDYSSDSTITCYGDSHLDQALKESTDPLESNPSPSKNIKITSGPVSQKILKKSVVVPQSANSQVKVIKKPDPEEQISKFIIALKPQAPTNVQLTENVQFAEIVRPDENVQLVKNMQLIKKLQLAKNVQIVKNVQLAKTVQSVKNVQLVKRLQPARNVHLAKILQQAKKQLAENVQTARNVQLATTVQPVKNVQLANKLQPAKNMHLAKILQQAKKQLAENVQTAKNMQTAKNLRPAKNVHLAKTLQQAKNQLPEKVQTAKNLQLAKNSQPANEQLVDNEQLAKNVQLAKKVQSKNSPSTLSTNNRPKTKAMVAANAARVKKRQRDPSDYAAFPGFISAFKDVDVEKGVKRKRKKYIRKIGPPLPCPHCEKVFKTQKGLNYHVSAMHGESNPVQCKCCGKVCRNAFVLKCHVMYSHAGKEMRTLDDFNPDLYCKQCDKHFSSQRVLKQHLLGLKHTPRELYAFECDTCSKRFPDKGPLQKHIDVVHLNMKPHECPSCDKRYSRRFQVRRHIAAAHARAPRSRDHVCHVCGKAFTVVSTLREHMFSHKGERPFVCKLCPATFTYSAALFTHNRLKHLKMKCKPKKKVPKGDKVEGKRKKRDKVEGRTEKRDELEGKTEKGVELEGKVEKGDAIEGKTEEIDVDQFFNKA